jgi:hypothetical protein
MHQHTVKQGESLWRIARRALKESGEPSTHRDILKAIHRIVDANKAEHPSLASNPNLIHQGWTLKMPIGSGNDGRGNGSPDLYQSGGDRSKPQGEPRSDSSDGSIPNAGNSIAPFGDKLAQLASGVARSLGTSGNCAMGVRIALGRLGLNISSDGSAVGLGRNIESCGRFAQVDGPLQPGDVIIRDHGPAGRARYGGRNLGDAGVYLGGGMQANDHIGSVKPNGSYYASLRAYRLIG